jgi:tRNA(fMet)-specific endonuclease VapC
VNKALLDTDTFSELGKGADQSVARNAAAYRTTFGRYTLSVITIMEIVRGPQKKRATRQLQTFLTHIASEEVLSFDQAAAERAGRNEGDLERVGRPIGRADPMTAAIAWQNGMELVTGNTAPDQRIQQIGSPLVLHNWRV